MVLSLFAGVGAVAPVRTAKAVVATVAVNNLQPSWDATGGGGVFSAYAGPPDYTYVSPGTTDVYDGREAGIVKDGLTVDQTYGDYEDEGLFGFKPTATIDVFAAGPVTYDVENQAGHALIPGGAHRECVGDLGIDMATLPETNPKEQEYNHFVFTLHCLAYNHITLFDV